MHEPNGILRIETSNAPLPLGHYSQAVECAGLIFLSGILPLSSKSGDKNSFREEVSTVLSHADAILRATGARREDVIKVTVYVTDVGNWEIFDEEFALFMGPHRPARAVVPVPVLHHDCQVELELIAKAQGAA
ncbi:hypothetical protein B0E33_18585 [Roseibium algicola]|uniref:Reactive intermediate/imine deaminase n=2 Tax=Roseibium algicola TaxID=2857014 RepID=A0ABN4X6C3_9HYPH|nr:hypothetical protein B0E33_18585 [Roseibium aggregatum]